MLPPALEMKWNTFSRNIQWSDTCQPVCSHRALLYIMSWIWIKLF